MFCEATYYKQKVSATVSGPRAVPIDDSIVPLGPREELPDTEFNHTGLHYLLGSGVSAVATERDWYAHHFLEQYTRLYDTGLSLPASPMVGFAVGSNPGQPAKNYGNGTALGEAFMVPHKMLFHLAVNQVLADVVDIVATNGTATYFMHGFIDLFAGQSTSKGSIDANYTSIPPQLVVWRALRARHYMLATVCVMALLCDVLAVGLGGLFNEGPTHAEYSIELKHNAAPRLSNDSLVIFNDMLRMPYPYEEHFYVTSANIALNTTLPPWTSTEYFFQPFTPTLIPNDNTTEVYRGRTRGFGVDPQCETARSEKQPPSLNLTDFKNKHSIPPSLECIDIYEPEYLRLNESTAQPQGPSSVESPDTFLSGRLAEPCAKTFIMGWGRTSNGSDINGTVESGFVLCYPRFHTAMFDVIINAEGHILEYEKATEMEYDLGYPGFTNQTDNLIIVSNNIIARGEGRWHNHTFTRDWMSELIRLEVNSSDLVDPLKPLPSPEFMLEYVGPTYTRLFALFLGLNAFIFDNDTSAEPNFEGQRWARETRIFMSEPAFVVSTTILSLSLVVAVVLYGWSITFFLPRMPTNIASVLAYVAPSTAVRECSAAQYRTRTFSFGRYIGVDGRAHVGIETDPSVVPIQLKSLRKGNTDPGQGWFGRLRKRRGEGHRRGDTWL
ncbi:hypothetical protein ACHAQH_005109 [Verticillium albo-atrum]